MILKLFTYHCSNEILGLVTSQNILFTRSYTQQIYICEYAQCTDVEGIEEGQEGASSQKKRGDKAKFQLTDRQLEFEKAPYLNSPISFVVVVFCS